VFKYPTKTNRQGRRGECPIIVEESRSYQSAKYSSRENISNASMQQQHDIVCRASTSIVNIPHISPTHHSLFNNKVWYGVPSWYLEQGKWARQTKTNNQQVYSNSTENELSGLSREERRQQRARVCCVVACRLRPPSRKNNVGIIFPLESMIHHHHPT